MARQRTTKHSMVRVLILDDDADLRELLGETLLALGAGSCRSAGGLAELQSQADDALACDLAILDINLGAGEPSGVDACLWLVERGFRGRIYFLTGHAASHPLVAEAAKIARASILAKPIDEDKLTEIVEEYRRWKP
jgi:DNA-binding NtrC family response regulator